ncbi:tripartite motif-containing protein 3-like [Diadema antillarum]|uniref:tripartite motif-containing protein 3-like n=1 Tax=Diadema antillarum TaxID=105358 RepID=UPI003A8A2DF3
MAAVHQISSQNLECPICLTLFEQPKSLTCSHTFCKDCLQRVSQTQPDQPTMICPICRKGTPLPCGDVEKLQTNASFNSLVDEVKTNPTCMVCEVDDKSPAVSYCQDCGKYMCKSCEKSHCTWKPFSTHDVVAVSEVLSGKVPLKRRRKCKKHPSEDEECFCTDCQEYVCLRCGMLTHLQAGHQIKEAAVHEEKLMESIKELKHKVISKRMSIDNHIKFIETQRNEITNIMTRLNNEIDKTYEEYMQLLSDNREALKSQVKQWCEKFEKELKVMEEESHQTISHMNAMEEMVTDGMKVPLEKESLFAHDTLRKDLKSFLARDEPNDQSPKGVAERAQKISFRRYVKVNELCLGGLESWDIKTDVGFLKIGRVCMNCAPDNKMAVRGWNSGISLFSPYGELQQSVLSGYCAVNIGFLSDGRSVVRDTQSKVSLYTQQWKKLDVTFETTGSYQYQSGYAAGLTVDRDDNIYVGYMQPQKIEVFTPQGGKAVRSMMCGGYAPQQIFAFHNTGNLILCDSAVVCLDGKGNKENVLKKEGVYPYSAVCRDDSVIVAWVKHKEGLVSIDRYTSELKHVQSLISDFQIQKTENRRYYLQEFESDLP